MDAARSLIANLTPRGRIVIAGAALGILVLVFLLFRMATAPSYTTLLTGVDPADMSKVTGALDKKGVGYEIQNNGTAIAVDKAKKADARIALAETGLPGKSKPGFELFDKQKLGASDFQQKVSYQRALEGELGRTVGQVDGVSDATVQLTLPDDQLFSEDSKQATAAVLISGSDSLDPAAVRGIARLTASSVEGLKPDNVTITDRSGTLLWPTGEAGGATGAGSKQAAEARYDRSMEGNLDALLVRTLGPGKAHAEVNAVLDTNQTTQDKLEYAKKGTPLKQHTEKETLKGGGGGGGASGAAGNIPSYAQGAAGGSGSNYNRQTDETDFGVDKTVTRTKIAPGAVTRQDVALVVDKGVPTAQVAELEKAVAAAAGVDRQRGDTMATSRIAFAKTPAPAAGPLPAGAIGIAKWIALGIASLLFLFFAGRHLRKRQDEALDAEPVWLRELNAPQSLAELEQTRILEMAGGGGPALERGPDIRDEVGDLVDSDPDRVAQQVRAWMNEG